MPQHFVSCHRRFRSSTSEDVPRQSKLHADAFNATKVRTFYIEDREYDNLLDLAQNETIDFEIDPDFVPNTSVEPIRKLQKHLHKVYDFRIDKLVAKDRA